MQVSCKVISDLLPLYVEDMLSEDSRNLVESHLKDCPSCQKLLEAMQEDTKKPLDDGQALQLIKTKLQKKHYLTILFSFLATFTFLAVILYFLTMPVYIPANQANIRLNEIENELLVADFDDQVAGYDIEVTKSDDNQSAVNYQITTWHTYWNEIFPTQKNHQQAILNPEGETVDAVYYYDNSGNESKLIYGENPNPNGGVIILPRLSLTYYFKIAIIITVAIGLGVIFKRKNYNKFPNLNQALFIPLAYVISHLLLKGFSFQTYSLMRDFVFILLLSIPIYLLLSIGYRLFKLRKVKK